MSENEFNGTAGSSGANNGQSGRRPHRGDNRRGHSRRYGGKPRRRDNEINEEINEVLSVTAAENNTGANANDNGSTNTQPAGGQRERRRPQQDQNGPREGRERRERPRPPRPGQKPPQNAGAEADAPQRQEPAAEETPAWLTEGQSFADKKDSFDFLSFGSRDIDAELDSMPPDPTLDAVFADAPVTGEMPESANGVEIVGIHFVHGGKVYYFDPAGNVFRVGDHAIVETARGVEFGDVAIANRRVDPARIVQPLRPVLRPAAEEDVKHNEENHRNEEEAFRICLGKIAAHRLDMKLVGSQYTFDNTKLIFYFTSAGRVDFRELVKDLASVFHTRIELRQIGIRDESKMIGGWGVCGRKLCCSGFLPNFAQVSIRMAKEQGLSLNSAKISGTCGRLMCCLRFEQETYERELADLPTVESLVETADGRGVVTEVRPVGSYVKVKLIDKPDQAPKPYKAAEIKVLNRAAGVRLPAQESADEELPENES